MSDVLSEIGVQIVSATKNGTDGIIARAVLLATGEEWTLVDMKRLTAVRHGVNAGFLILYLDGEPILELHDPHIGGSELLSRDPADHVYSVRVSQNYRLLGKAAERANGSKHPEGT